jgi:lysosomal Pro-X carboxypeptidase
MDMKVDHFNKMNQATYKMRYLINTKNFGPNPNAPIFMYAGNEGQVTKFYENSGWLVETLAKEYNAVVVFPEHRYFGKSWPFGTKEESMMIKNLYALTVEQVMADYNSFANEIRRMYNGRPIVLFGGSYGGMLAAWLRMKYPSTFVGAVASSAPIIQFLDAAPVELFYKIITDAYVNSSKDCSGSINQTHRYLDPAKFNMKALPEL